MSQTKEGIIKARETNIRKAGSYEAWKQIMRERASRGGKKGHTGGFAAAIPCNCEIMAGEHLKRECSGRKGGRISRRRGA